MKRRFKRKPLKAMSSAELDAVASRMLRKAGFYPKREEPEDEYVPVEAEAICQNGGLRATWTGKP